MVSVTDSFLKVPAPAKLNLFLHINKRLPNGYHQLQSLFILIDWMDSLDFILRTDGRITRSQEGGRPLPENDLCMKAARALQQATGCSEGVHMHIRKSIPEQAGMGGGSSNAATCLLALNRLWGLGLTREQLLPIGLTLGADVPFFLFGRTAWVEGVGEQLQAIEIPQARWLVVKPESGVSTAEIFASQDLVRNTPAVTMRSLLASKDPLLFGRNDLQPVASALCPDIEQVLCWMKSTGLQGRMTGSGSAVFALLPEHLSDTFYSKQSLPEKWNIRVCRSIPAHPLIQWAA